MKKISTIELIALNGGSGPERDCMWFLQYELGTHTSSGNKNMEDKYWEGWNKRFEDCVNGMPPPTPGSE